MIEEVTLTVKEQKRLRLLNEVKSRKMTIVRAAASMGRSERQVYQLLARARLGGAAALAYGRLFPAAAPDR